MANFLKKQLQLNEMYTLFKDETVDLVSSFGHILIQVLNLNLELVYWIEKLDANERDNQDCFEKAQKVLATREQHATKVKNSIMHIGFRKQIVAAIEKRFSDGLVDLKHFFGEVARNLDIQEVYHSLLFELPMYPYVKGENVLFEVKISTDNRNDPNPNINSLSIKMFNSPTKSNKIIQDYLNSVENNNKDSGLYYHATNHDSAQSILTSGIILSKGNNKQDFSNGYGFYLSETLENAEEWAKQKGNIGAVIVFKVPNAMLDVTLENGLDVSKTFRMWEKIVHFYREHPEGNAKTKNLVKNKTFIRGPICINPSRGPRDRLQGFGREIQICIKEHEYSRRFGSLENICCVIFYAN